MNDFMELQRLFTAVLRRWWLFVLITGLVAAGGYQLSQRQPKVYQATTTILVGESIKSSQLDRVDIQTSQALVQTYVDIARRQPVLEGVVTELQLPVNWQSLKKQVEVSQVPDTQLIEVRVEASSPEAAEVIANSLANQLLLISPSHGAASPEDPNREFNARQILILQDKIQEGQRRLNDIEVKLKSPVSAEQQSELEAERAELESLLVEWGRNYTAILPFATGGSYKDPSQLTVIEPAHASSVPVRPRVNLNTALSAGLGMLLAFLLIYLLDFLDDTFKSSEDLGSLEGLRLLGSIGRIPGRKISAKVIATSKPRSAITEAYRMVRSRVRFGALEQPVRTLMITSAMPGEGKSITAANLAVVFAQANLRTILVDADLRKPALHRILGLQYEKGLGDLLESSELELSDCLQETGIKNLQFLASGKDVIDPSERLSSERMTQVMKQLEEAADAVIFDSPPALIFADASDMAHRMDGVALVVRARSSKRDAVNQALFSLRSARAEVLGSIFNDAPRSRTASLQGAYLQERSRFSLPKPRRVKPTETVVIAGSAAPVLEGEIIQPEIVELETVQQDSETATSVNPTIAEKVKFGPYSNNGRNPHKKRKH